ncbi:uncharacterized protein N7496_007688 [Penicillium cataractarum]|uniref:Uncharacterized protein n=1 Tax=Penicillium cataractarum TaxID=2100454 RepID=A0A9W9V3U8_9EURO|nr:uncharacterized protein N7496_007688 [Penicillium cataractarum]KAJ5367928.1 hypothetical protein N7496_007688 [Penicillium cataractarum]
MPSSVSGSTVSTPPRGGMIPRAQVSPPRPQARSAGMAERPSRNENLSDLVRFFQTAQSTPTPGPSSVQAPTSPDSTTALPVVTESVEPKGKQLEMAKEVKPLHRRLLQFTQRQKKDLFPKSKLDDNQRQIEALQREGYLLPAPKPRSNHSAKTSISSKNSLERTFSKSKKQDVETIGQPWLDNDTKKGPSDFKRRLASLDLSDFGSMVDVAVSLSQQFDDSSPPPYQSLSSSGAASRGEQNSASQSSPTLPLSSSIYSRSNSDRPMSPPTSTAGTLGSVSQDDPGRQYSSASGSNMRTVDPDTKPTTQGLNIKPVGEDTPALSRPSVSSESKPDQSIGPAETATQTSDKSTSSSSGSPPSQPSLKLFPDVAPPRMSSKNAWRISSVPQYQRPPNPPSSAGTESPPGASELKPGKSTPSDISSRRSKDEGARRCSGVTTTSAVSTESATAEINNSQPSTQSKTKARPPSLAMGTLQAFPLPAPTRPLPSIPQPGRAPPAVPDAKTTTTVRTVRSTLKAPDVEPSHPSPIAEHPCEPGPDETQANEPPTDTRAATALGYAGEADSVADHDNAKSIHTPERPKSTSPEQSTPRRRASSIRIPRMQDLPESPDHEEQEGLPIADSPLLGQMTPTKVHDKRAPPPPLRTLRIDPRLDRNNLPFGLPSPPPTAALPSEPPTQPLPERPQGGRNYTAPIPASLHSSKGMDLHFAVGHHRASMISRSNSSRSSLRHESIPESSEPSRCESPLPSSDDEGFGPGADTTRSHRTSEKHPTRAHPLHQGYATMDARPSHGRLRYPHPIRTQTPQGRSSRTLEKSAMSPQSTYSQPTRRSRESHNTHRPQPNASQMTQYLEDRVANLERQNQILQAALMAALNAGVKNPFEGLGDSALPPGFSHLSHPSPYQSRFTPRPESWVSSSHSSENSGFETPGSYREGRPHVRQSDNRMEDIESGGWMSDKSSMSGARMARSR